MGKPAILLVDPVRSGVKYKAAAGDLGFAVASLYTSEFSASTPANEAGDDFSTYGADIDAVARQIADSGLDVRAVVPATEGAVFLADHLADRLGLAGNNPRFAWARRNKAAMRERAAESGLRVPEFRLAHDEQQVRQAVAELAFPAIVKPTMGACSQGVVVLSSEADLPVLDDLVTHDLFGEPITEWLVERYVRGSEYAVNFYSVDGEHRLVDVWEYLMPDDRDYDFPVWETIQLAPTDARVERVADFVQSTLDAFGIRLGPSHTEVKLDEDGEVHLIEVAARLPGGPFTEMWDRHSDVIRPFHDSVECYLGRRPALMDEPPAFKAVFGSLAINNEDRPGTLRAVHGLEHLDRMPGIDRVLVDCRPGDHLRVTTDSSHIPLSVFVTGPDADAVLATMKTVRSLVSLDVEPDPVP
ncbi:ATP-grasp domain-containing protein [Lentzea sp. JNUCC 0626]|uniref:ATP-grasp domain-containing protein n=1 Tax=Lentzea sp. JNUCC 0626 TaxID=3367513 RepID=UPI00374837B0